MPSPARFRRSIFAAAAALALAGAMLAGAPAHAQPAADIRQCDALYKKGDHRKALACYRPLAEDGSPAAQFRVGAMYHAGEGAKRNRPEAVKWYAQAAEQGDARAQFQLGAIYDGGAGVEKDRVTGYVWYALAATSGDEKAAAARDFIASALRADDLDRAQEEFQKRRDEISSRTEQKISTDIEEFLTCTGNISELVKVLKTCALPLAQKGNIHAQNQIGAMFDFGWAGGVVRKNEAAKWYRQAAEQGYSLSQYSLGVMYLKGEGVDQNAQEAMRWLHLAAEQNYAPAQYNLGVMYRQGDGVQQDAEEAAKWLRLAAEQGYDLAQFSIGQMYRQGEGVPEEKREAVRWFRKAARQSNVEALAALGEMYRAGEGVPPNKKAAVGWYAKAAEQGHASAMTILGLIYDIGDGVKADPVEAYIWLSLAVAGGNKDVEGDLKKAEGKLSAAQRRDAQEEIKKRKAAIDTRALQ